jgi:NAD(P)-dependent dehydrogenase (short-subunit alcohol dehydrogenase family)
MKPKRSRRGDRRIRRAVAGGAVVITGTSTGIGRATALRLDAAGYDVFAGVRRSEDAEGLRAEASDRLRTLIVDVTDADAIAAAAREVDEAVGERGVAGLVNNAGASMNGPLEFLPIEDIRHQLEVNLLGPIAVTQAFLPLIRRARGRIVNMSSVGGRVTNGFLGPYQASKSGLEVVTDALRKELRPWGIHVVAIEPGSIDTEIWRKGTEAASETLERLPPEGRELYGEAIEKGMALAGKLAQHAAPPERGAAVVERALSASRPRTRYIVGIDARAQIMLDRLLPDRAMDAVEARMLGA